MSTNPIPYENLARIDYPKVEEGGQMPELTREAVRTEARDALLDIRDYITTDAFIAMLGELYDLPPEERDEFVRSELLDVEHLATRGILPPAQIKVQRSQFGDHRPTIFCVTRLLSDEVRKVTYTFDGESLGPAA